MSQTLERKIIDYLDRHRVMTLATVGPDGPWAAAVYYARENFTLYFVSDPESRHCADIAAQSRVAATIQEDYADWTLIQSVQLEGRATMLQGSERDLAMFAYQTKFPITGGGAPPEVANALARSAWYRVVPERFYFVDNTRGLGHRDELELA